MKKLFVSILALAALVSACGSPATPAPATATAAPLTDPLQSNATPTPAFTATPTLVPPTATPTLTPTPAYPPEGRGPAGFATNVNPLTGLEVKDPTLLDRRPIVVKVENIPREHRPQWGLSLADLVYEYYTEFGATRFAAVFYGTDAEQVGPIRSGRFFDSHIVQMYKAILVYGSAYVDVRNRFYNSDFANRLILETLNSCPAVCRFDPSGQNLLVANTAALQPYVKTRNVDNTRQNLDGMYFKLETPQDGKSSEHVYVRYSGAIYNRWDYNPQTGRYERFSDVQNDVNHESEVYTQLTDRLTSKPVSAENVVMLCIPHQYYVKRDDAEVLDILMDPQAPDYYGCDGQSYQGGNGAAYVARDGQIFKVNWKRESASSVVTLVNPDGSPFPLKPGQTWFEVIGASSKVEQQPDGAWRFTHHMAP